MAHDLREKVELLVIRAISTTEEDDEEARNAAVKACQILRKHPELLARSTASDEQGPAPPPKPEKPSEVHPAAQRFREWQVMMRTKRLTMARAKLEAICADCGNVIAMHEKIVVRKEDDLMTHYDCRAWWWNYDVPDEDDDEIPF